jgi:hypothetical protein
MCRANRAHPDAHSHCYGIASAPELYAYSDGRHTPDIDSDHHRSTPDHASRDSDSDSDVYRPSRHSNGDTH